MIRNAQHRTWIGLLAAAAVAVALLALATPVTAQKLTNEDVAKISAGPQPIKFSHKVHAGDNNIDCQYCHIYARRSYVSGAPPVEICAGCHKYVGTQLDEVKKVMGYWERKEPIPWVKIHDVPDFVRYPHYKHINAKNEVYPNGIKCQTCHGPIETMNVVHKYYSDFGTMGWCLKCHLTIPGTLEFKRAVASATNPHITKDSIDPNGGYRRPLLTDCLTCHY
ncbi:MAG TPA: cytochrome c3 family protein [bacterium]|nr:cytochrome c3 family protein [bacterium]